MRLFVGIELPDAVKRAAAAAAERLRERTSRVAPNAVLRWVDPANLHITLWFLGELPDARAEAIVAALEPPLHIAPFTLQIAGAGAFPDSGPPRAIWLGLPGGREPLVAVHDQLRRRLVPIGFEPEKRAYSPHLTIARVKDISRAESLALRRVLTDIDVEAGSFEVRNVTLFSSRLSPKGSQYASVLRVPLE